MKKAVVLMISKTKEKPMNTSIELPSGKILNITRFIALIIKKTF
ncbi:hypothetical protein [Dolichospermum compactum]|nr:hypothetical protein [Dolichospermum compactum]